MKYVGIAERAALIIVILPPNDSNLPFQLASLFCIFSISVPQLGLVIFPKAIGNPRYVIGRVLIGQSKI